MSEHRKYALRFRRPFSFILLNCFFWPAMAMAAQALPSVDTQSFKLVFDGQGYSLVRSYEGPFPLPREWLIPPNEVEEDAEAFVSSFKYDDHVTAFPIGDNLTGLHVSSYEIQREGSAQAAAGRDTFLVFDEGTKRIHYGGIGLGITKERVRSMGCPFAKFSRFIIGDINNDQRIDVGVVKEETTCVTQYDEEKGVERQIRPIYEKRPIRWHAFSRDHWDYNPEYDGKVPPGDHVELPMIGLTKSPVDFVRELYSIRTEDRALSHEQERKGGRQAMILFYSDFGPQVLAHELVGFNWYQWDRHGDSSPNTKYDVKVVVYKNINLNRVQELYPVIEEKKQDFRYVTCREALGYLDRHIKEFEELQKTDKERFVEIGANELISVFQKTKGKIIKQLDCYP